MQVSYNKVYGINKEMFSRSVYKTEKKIEKDGHCTEIVEYHIPSVKKNAVIITDSDSPAKTKSVRFQTWLTQESILNSITYNYSLEHDGKQFKFVDANVNYERRNDNDIVRSLTSNQKNEILFILDKILKDEKDAEKLEILRYVYDGTKAMEPSDK